MMALDPLTPLKSDSPAVKRAKQEARHERDDWIRSFQTLGFSASRKLRHYVLICNTGRCKVVLDATLGGRYKWAGDFTKARNKHNAN